MNEETVQRLRTLQPAARAANGLAAVNEVISNLIEIVPTQSQPPAHSPGPLALLATLPLLQGLLPEIRSVRVQRGDDSVGFEWDAEIELEDGIRFGEGTSAAGAILCATIEILSGQLPS